MQETLWGTPVSQVGATPVLVLAASAACRWDRLLRLQRLKEELDPLLVTAVPMGGPACLWGRVSCSGCSGKSGSPTRCTCSPGLAAPWAAGVAVAALGTAGAGGIVVLKPGGRRGCHRLHGCPGSGWSP